MPKKIMGGIPVYLLSGTSPLGLTRTGTPNLSIVADSNYLPPLYKRGLHQQSLQCKSNTNSNWRIPYAVRL